MTQLSDFRQAKEFALRYGVKAVVYGGPGTGKTPICALTAPRAGVIITEPGYLSMRNQTSLTLPAFNIQAFDDFMTWATLSAEAKQFHTFVIDSISQICERHISDGLAKGNKSGGDAHGKKVYGDMARWAMGHLNTLYFMQEKHIVLITKQHTIDLNGVMYAKPYFPGQELPVRVPHLFDAVLRLGTWTIPGVAGPTRAFRTREQYDMMARDRSGNLEEYEPADLTKLFAKCMA